MDCLHCGMAYGRHFVIVVGQGVVEWVARVNKEIDGYGAAVGIGVAHDGEIQGGVVYHRWCGTSI